MMQPPHFHRRALVTAALSAVLVASSPLALAQPRDPGGPPRPPQREGPMREPPTIVAVGRGESTAAPDRAVVRLGAVAQAEQASAAQEQVNEIVRRAIDALTNAGIPERDVQTADLSLSPVYSDHQPPRPLPGQQQGQQEPRITGYRASNTVEVRVNNIAKVGDVIDAGVNAGANQLQGVTFELKDDAKARAEALTRAVEEARADAETMAAALGVTLGPVEEVIAGGGDVIFPQPRFGRMAMEVAAAGMGAPVQPGEVRVNASATVRFRINQTRDRGGDRGDRGDRPATRPGREQEQQDD